MRPSLPLAVLLTFLLLPGACIVSIGGPGPDVYTHTHSVGGFSARAQKELSTGLDLEEGETLHLSTSFGDIRVEASRETRPFLTAKLTIHASTEEKARTVLQGYRLETVRTAAGLVVRVVGEPLREESGGTEIEQSPSVAFHAIVPPGTPLVLESSSGDIKAEGPLGHVSAEVSFGDVELFDVLGADVTASSGDVTVKGIRGGACRLESSFGDVDARGVLTDVDARASSGDVTVTAKSGSKVAAPWSIRSSFGDVELTLPADAACQVRAKTSFGSIDTAVAGTRSESTSGGSFRGEVGGGGELVTLETSSGDVTLTSR